MKSRKCLNVKGFDINLEMGELSESIMIYLENSKIKLNSVPELKSTE